MLGLVIYYFVTRSAEDCGYLYALLHVLLRTVNSPLAGCHFPFSRIHRWRAAQMSSFCRNEVVIAPFHRNTAPFNVHDRRTWPACSRGRAQSRRTIAVAFCVDQDTTFTIILTRCHLCGG